MLRMVIRFIAYRHRFESCILYKDCSRSDQSEAIFKFSKKLSFKILVFKIEFRLYVSFYLKREIEVLEF